ncbi:BspA family leucine-rich repeat surface protein [Enterococcus sp. DIV1420a]|uniref:BspA family leucine-rich repeat surface protein n=1 Tax=Enterococcus sp. DIV1420a TaxID=2774672 RepID=UPI003F2799D6
MTIGMMKKYSKRLFSGLMVTLLLGGNLISSVGAYAETVPIEPKIGETTGGESPTPPNGEKETSFPGLQDNLPKPAEPPVKEPTKVESPTEAPKAEEPKVDSKAEAEPKEEPAKETESEEDDEELPQLSNLEAGDSPEAPNEGSEEVTLYEAYIGSSHIWISITHPDRIITLHIGAGDFNNDPTRTHAPWERDWPFRDRQGINKIKIEGPLILPVDSNRIFAGFSDAEVFEGTNYLNTSYVETMQEMFSYSGFKKLNLSSFNTSNVVYMDSMFAGDTELQEVNVSSFDTKRVRNFDYMFWNTKITSLDLSPFDFTRKTATDFVGGKTALTKITLGPNTRLRPNLDLNIPPNKVWLSTSEYRDPITTNILLSAYNNFIEQLIGTWELGDGNTANIFTKDLTLYSDSKGVAVGSSLNTSDSLYSWEPKDSFVSAYDSSGRPLNFSQVKVDSFKLS